MGDRYMFWFHAGRCDWCGTPAEVYFISARKRKMKVCGDHRSRIDYPWE